MRLEKASYQAIKFACLKYHYAKAVPQSRLGYSVFNDSDEWCGVILFSNGANQHIASSFNLVQGQVMELVRVALNGKQECTSQALAMSLKAIRPDAPLIKLIVSYADRNQGHIGVIYQATNWYYLGEFASERGVMLNGKLTHRRSVNAKYGTSTLEWLKKNVDPRAEVIKGDTKIKYVYPIDRRMIKSIRAISKPYPKRVIV